MSELREKVRFQTNIPQVVTLAFDEGVPVKGAYGDQIMWGLEGNRVMFIDPHVAAKLDELGVRAHEPVRITKSQVKKGNRQSIEWQVERVEEEPATEPAPPAASKQAGEAAPQGGPGGPPSNGHCTTAAAGGAPRPHTRLEDALKTVIAAVHASRQYAKEIGFEMPVFTAEDLRTMANTLMIEGRNGGPR